MSTTNLKNPRETAIRLLSPKRARDNAIIEAMREDMRRRGRARARVDRVRVAK